MNAAGEIQANTCCDLFCETEFITSCDRRANIAFTLWKQYDSAGVLLWQNVILETHSATGTIKTSSFGCFNVRLHVCGWILY